MDLFPHIEVSLLDQRARHLDYERRWREKNKDRINEKQRENYKKNAGLIKKKNNRYYHTHKEQMFERDLVRKHGISLSKYNQILIDQKQGCAICGRVFGKKNRFDFASVDHCHETGKIRGLLCNTCNRAIGLFHDDFGLLRKAIQYLEKAKEK